MLLKEITGYLDSLASFSLQEDYDNSGVLIGEPEKKIVGILCALDVTEEIILEAKALNCNLIIAHHPFIFSGIKRIQESNWVHRVLIEAIKNDIAVIAIHTNLDNVMEGVNGKIAEVLSLKDLKILRQKENQLVHLSVFTPATHEELVRNALFSAGAGAIGNYNECSFTSTGVGTFKPGPSADPFVGEINILHRDEEKKIEVVFPQFLQNQVLKGMREAHPYEEIAYNLTSLKNTYSQFGSGVIGELQEKLTESDFFSFLKQKFNLKLLRHTHLTGKEIKKVALCGGAGFFLLKDAIKMGADAFVTADLKYHDFFEADGKTLLVDIGHFESEQFTIDLLCEQLLQKFPTFAVRKTKNITNPVNYYFQ